MKSTFTLVATVIYFLCTSLTAAGQLHSIAWTDKFDDNFFKMQQPGFSSDSKYLAMGYDKGIIRVYTADSGIVMRTAQVLPGHVYCTRFVPGTSLIACGDKNGLLVIYDFLKDTIVMATQGHEKAITAMCMSKDGRYMVTGSKDRSIRMWALPTDSIVHGVWYSKGKVQSVYLADDNQTVIAGFNSISNGLRMFDMSGEVEVNRVDISNVQQTAVSPDGGTVAVASLDKKLFLFNLRMNRVVKSLRGHKHNLAHVVYDNTGRVLYSGANDHRVIAWLADGTKHMSIFNAGHNIDVLACSPNGKYLLVMASNELMTVIDVAHMEEELKAYQQMELEN